MERHYTVEEIAELLTLHPKTIQRYIREGKIIANKVGKRWCISESDLKKFIGKSEDTSSVFKDGQSKVSAVADIVVQDSEEAIRLEKILVAMLNSKSVRYGNSSMHLQYLEYENKVRVTLWGNLAFVRNVLDAVSEIIEQQK